MKKIILSGFFNFFFLFAFTQNNSTPKSDLPVVIIKVPDFADPEVKKFYTTYSSHLVKCIEAIRQNDERKATALFKNPGEQLVAREKAIVQQVVKNPVEKQKYFELAKQVYPYLKEVQQSMYYRKLYGR